MRFKSVQTLCVVVAASCGIGAFTSPAEAEFIGLELQDNPDIASGLIDVVYDFDNGLGVGTFEATGTALVFDDDGSPPNPDILNGLFSIDAEISATGVVQSGSLEIGGNVGGFGPTLLTGNLIDFGFADAGGMLLEFLFEVTGGDLAAQFGDVVGVIMDVVSGEYSGDWTQSFDNLDAGQVGTGLGLTDTAALVPGPGSLVVLLAVGVIGSSRRRRTR